MVEKIKDIILSVLRGVVRWIPEVLLVIFAISLLPLVYFVGRIGFNLVSMLFSRPDFVMMAIQSSPWASIAWAICLVAVGLVVWLVARCWKHLWAVARKMIIEAMHRKVVVGLLIFFMVLMPSLRFILETEGSLKSHVQIVLTYSLTLAQILLSLIAVFLCTASLCSEIEEKHVFLVDSKPLNRWKLLAGKLLGVVVMATALLFLMSGSVYGLITHMARPRPFTELREWEAEEKREMVKKVHEEVLVARLSRRPATPDLTEQVNKELQDLRDKGELQRPAQKAEEIQKRLLNQFFTAQTGESLQFVFPGIRPRRESPLYLRFKPTKTNPEGPELAQGTWVFYYVRQNEGEEEGSLEPAFRHSGKWAMGAYQEIKVPPEVVSPRGVVRAVYWNFEPGTGVQFDSEGSIELLQRVGGFFPNFYRTVLIILFHVILLAALGLMLAAAFTFPVASFTVGAILLLGLLGPWLTSAVLVNPSIPADASVGELFSGYLKGVVNFILRLVLFVIPQFGRYSAMDDLANGRLVSWAFVGQAGAVMCVLKAGLAMLLGAYFYWRRELARIIA